MATLVVRTSPLLGRASSAVAAAARARYLPRRTTLLPLTLDFSTGSGSSGEATRANPIVARLTRTVGASSADSEPGMKREKAPSETEKGADAGQAGGAGAREGAPLLNETVVPPASLGSRGEGWVAMQGALLVSILLPLDTLLAHPLPSLPFCPSSFSLLSPCAFLGAALSASGVLVLVRAFSDLGDALTPMPRPVESSSSVKQHGVYGLVRHPMYSASLLVGAGVAVLSASSLKLLLSGVLGLVLWGKAGVEEQFLVAKYGREYQDYQKKVKRFLPYIL